MSLYTTKADRLCLRVPIYISKPAPEPGARAVESIGVEYLVVLAGVSHRYSEILIQ